VRQDIYASTINIIIIKLHKNELPLHHSHHISLVHTYSWP